MSKRKNTKKDNYEKYKEEFGANYKQRTKESLKAEIQYRTEKINKNLKTLDKEAAASKIFLNAVQEANVIAGSKQRTKLVAGTSKSRYKESLIRQARELKSIEQIDIYSEEGKKKLEQRYQQSFESFKENVDSEVSLADYDRMVEAFGAIGHDLINRRSSDDFVDAFTTASEKGKIKFVDIWKDIEKEAKGKQWTTYKQMENFKAKLRNYGE